MIESEDEPFEPLQSLCVVMRLWAPDYVPFDDVAIRTICPIAILR